MNKSNSSVLIYIFIISLLELLLTFLIKYDLNSLAIGEFSLFYIGNIIPIGVELILIFALILQLINKRTIGISHKLVMFFLATSSISLILFSYLASKLNFQFPPEYIFNYPYKRVVPGISLMISFFIKIYLIILVVNLFFNSGFVVYFKSLLTSLFVFIISIGLIYFLTTQNGYNKLELLHSDKSIGVVLGAAVWDDVPSTLFKGRIEKANELLQKHKISRIQLTGSNAPGEISEAKAAFNYGLKLGIRHHLMVTEENTTTTTEQIKFIKKMIVNNTKYDNIIIVSDQFHLTRVLEICKFFDVKAIGVASDYHLTTEKLLYYRLRESIALLLFWLFAI